MLFWHTSGCSRCEEACAAKRCRKQVFGGAIALVEHGGMQGGAGIVHSAPALRAPAADVQGGGEAAAAAGGVQVAGTMCTWQQRSVKLCCVCACE